jgi:hypothetical protein
MTTSAKSVKYAPPIEIDPNFFLPPTVVDMRYRNLEDASDSTTTRSDQTGEVVNVDYDEVSYSELERDTDPFENESVSTIISPPDYVTVVSQQVRVASDGKFVVDIILDVEDVPDAIQYDVRLTKP